MLCEKSIQDVGTAIFVLTVMMFSFGCTFYGLYRYTFNMVKDEQQYAPWFITDHLILAGNILQVFSLAGTMYFLQGVQSGPIKIGIIMATFLLMIITLYLTNFDSGANFNPGFGWAGMVMLVIDLYVKVTAVFLGFGVCSMEEIPKVMSAATKTIFGGHKRR